MISFSKIFLGLVVSLFAGAATAVVFLNILPSLHLPYDHPLFTSLGVRKPIVMGFMPYWLISKAQPASLDTLNSITYFGLTVHSDGTLVEKSTPQETEPGWQNLKTDKFTNLIKDRSFKTSLLIHQSNEASISALMSNPEKHAQNLVSAAEPIMQKYRFTDLNLDIESFKTASPEAQLRMSTFLREVKKQMSEKKLGTVTTELTVASLIRPSLIDPQVAGEVSDYVVLMAYDFHYTGSEVSGPVAPLSGATKNREYDVTESVKLATQIIPPEKILLGIPLYGYEWETLTEKPEAAVVPGTGKTATAIRVEESIKNCPDCVRGRDDFSGTPYLILPPNEDSSIQQIFYEDAESLGKKLELAKTHKLGGVALWAVGYENEALFTPVNEYKNSFLWQKSE